MFKIMSTVYIILQLSSLSLDIIFFLNLTCLPVYAIEINKTQMNNVQQIYIFYV